MTDQEWILFLQNNDPDAISLIWDLLFKASVMLCHQRGLDEQMAYEAASRSYDRIMKNGIIQFHFACKFRNYCFRIVSNEIYRILTQRQEVAIEDADNVESSSDDLTSKQIHDALKLCLNRLPDRLRIACHLVFLEGRGPDEVAEIMGIQRNYVNKLTFLARKQLLGCLKERGYHSPSDFVFKT